MNHYILGCPALSQERIMGSRMISMRVGNMKIKAICALISYINGKDEMKQNSEEWKNKFRL